VHYAVSQQARLVGRVNWDVKIDDQLLEADTAESLLSECFGSGLSELSRLCAAHLLVSGAYYLAQGQWADDQHYADDLGGWTVLACPISGTSRQQAKTASVLIHVLNADPADPSQPDSPVLAAGEVISELLLARAQARASARSRTAQLQTVLYPLDGVAEPAEFEASLLDMISSPIMDEHSVSSVAPNLIGFPGEMIDQWRTLDFTGPVDEKVQEKISNLVKQLAVILDSPPEILLGTGEVNHWSAWQIQEDNWLGHVEPLARRVGDGFARALSAAANVDLGRVQVLPDPSPLLQRRPLIADVLAAYQGGLVSGEWARAQLGADEDDRPTLPPEQQSGGVAVMPPTRVEGSGSTGEPTSVTAAVGVAEIARGVAEASGAWIAQRLADVDRQLFDSVEDLVTSVVERVLTRVGARVRSRLQGSPEALAWRDKTNAELAVMRGAELAGDAGELVAGLLVDRFGRLVARAVSQCIQILGVGIEADAQLVDDAASGLVAEVTQIIEARLAGRPEQPGRVWGAVRGALAIAGGQPRPVSTDEAVTAAIPLAGWIGIGVALGGIVGAAVKAAGWIAEGYRWVHAYTGDQPYPPHQALDGQNFDGLAVNNFSPGDHVGCRCYAKPVLVWKGPG